MSKQTLAFIIPLILIAGMAGFYLAQRNSQEELPVYYPVPEFRFVTADGTPFGREELLGKVSVIDFIFTRCMGPCPVMSAKMKWLYEEFAHEPDVQFISISVDPEFDSPQVLQDYAASFGVADQRWYFLREPDLNKVARLSEQGFKLAAQDLPAGHATSFILVDREGQIRGYFDGTREDSVHQLPSAIRKLL